MIAKRRPRVALREEDPLPPEDRDSAHASDTIGALYRAHQSRLTRFFARQLDAEQAPDLLNRVFVRFLALAVERRARIVSAEAYLVRSARNLIRDERKAACRHGLEASLSADEELLTAPCQIAALEARDMLNRIEQAIGKLKPITRQIFLAHRLDGYTYAEIAERTGLSVKGVEKHMSRAIAHIDRTLAAR